MKNFMQIIAEAISEDMIDTNASPEQNDPNDAAHYEARRRTGFFGEQASGCVLMAKSTGRMLIVLRSAGVDQPHTWGNVGGAHDASERPMDAAKREAHEETGYTGQITMVPLLVFSKDTFRYSNFLGIVDDEFTPHLGWEADSAKWVNFGRWPTPLHFGLKALFGDAPSVKTIKHYATMFAKGETTVEGIEEDVDVAMAIRDANKMVKQGVTDPEAEDAAATGTPGAPVDPKAAQGAPAPANGAVAKPGAVTAPKPGAPPVPANGAPAAAAAAANVPAAKKSLAPITSQ